MQNATATLHCPNCQTLNPESHRFCQQCRTLLPKRYLWAVGQVEAYKIGDFLADRYLVKGERVLLDTQPGSPVENGSCISETVEAYLKLFPYRLHIPQVYSLVESDAGHGEILLLEQAPITSEDYPGTVEARYGAAVPWARAWAEATALRQLNWLWQVARLWQPLSSQGVASSLLHPELLRVEGSIFRLLELRLDQGQEPTLAQLGQMWLQWIPAAHAVITAPLEQLCQQMIQDQYRTAEQLAAQLDQWLERAGQLQTYHIGIASRTDQGPARKRNEDACYPPDGTVVSGSPQALMIVCDGVGGHAGGALAASLATEEIQGHLKNLEIEALDPRTLTSELETAICIANDEISRRNDTEQRQDRQRMGTTLVMALARAHEIYIAHVGDSRAYWITRTGCYQVTLDDDVASREVRLGYTLYREALTQPTSGALVQALGMGNSTLLRPTVQRFVLDEDCVFLLCSDGLSDYDRVEECWETEILPILDGGVDLATASQRLVELANRKNGHDNVTVGLLHYQVTQAAATSSISLGLSDTVQQASDSTLLVTPDEPAKTQLLKPDHRSLTKLLLVSLFSGLCGLLAYGFISPLLRPRYQADNRPASVSPIAPSASPMPSTTPVQTLAVGSRLRINSAGTGGGTSAVLLDQPASNSAVRGVIPTGSILQVLKKQTIPNRGNWLQVKVCANPPTSRLSSPPVTAAPPTSVPTPSVERPPSEGTSPQRLRGSPNPLLTSGTSGWIREPDITSVATVLKPERLSSCATSSLSGPTDQPG